MGQKMKLLVSPLLLMILVLTTSSSNSQSIIKTLPGYHGDLPFKLETGYVGVGENEEVELFYYFAESQRNPEEDPIIFNMPGGPGYSGLYSFAYGREGPLSFNDEHGLDNITFTLNPNSWTKEGFGSLSETRKVWGDGQLMHLKTREVWRAFVISSIFNRSLKDNSTCGYLFQNVIFIIIDRLPTNVMYVVIIDRTNKVPSVTITEYRRVANMIFLDIPAGVGFSYAKTTQGWLSSDSVMASHASAFIRKFLINHPMFLNNPLYIAGISYMGLINPLVTLQLYEGNERGDQPWLNIQGYILCGPLTDKFRDFNSRFEFAHRMALISDDIYKLGTENCNGNYINTHTSNSLCAHSLQRYEECTSQINLDNILLPPCNESNPMPYCTEYSDRALHSWGNNEVVQRALNIHMGTIGTWYLHNSTMHYAEGKNDTFCYSYDIFSSFSHHKKLVAKGCQALVFSGDHDMAFPYVGVEQWIALLNISVETPWAPFFIKGYGYVGGYETKYAQKDFSLTFATVRGAGHSVPVYKPEESFDVVSRWLTSQNYSRSSRMQEGRAIYAAST